jgi:CheY-like chemotaxis protein
MNDSRHKFLIVDDNDLVRMFLLKLLELYELEAECAANGQEAIELWEKNNFTAVLMDLEMPVMGGFESSRIIRQREKVNKRPRTPIYAVSGTTMYDIQNKCSDAGMDGFIAKPVVINKLLDTILPLVR